MKDEKAFLEHYGVKGQRWGIRRKSRVSKGRKRPTPRASDEGAAALKILDKQKRFGTQSLTNHELRIINSRAKLEKEFASLFPKPPGKLDKKFAKLKKGENYVKGINSAVDTGVKAYRIFKMPEVQKAMGKGKKVMVETTKKNAGSFT